MTTVLEIAAAVVLLYAVLVGAMWWYARSLAEPATLREAVRFGPDLVGLVRRLIAGPGLSRPMKAALFGLGTYLVLPVDLVPDVVPLVGWADDVAIAVLVLRAVVRRAGGEAIRANWRGSAAGLAVLQRLLRVH